jgi:RNA polymerase sigma-19 factor, ECF subfamily
METPILHTNLTGGHFAITPERFAEIYNEHYAQLLNYTHQIVNNKEQAQDIVADLFCELWDNREGSWDTLIIRTKLRDYLEAMARNMADEHLARSAADSQSATAHLATVHGWNIHSDGVEKDPQTAFIQKEKSMLLRQLFARLSPQKQEVVQLRMSGLSYQEIAASIHITVKKVEYHLSTAIYFLHAEIRRKPYLKDLSLLLMLPQLTTCPELVNDMASL